MKIEIPSVDKARFINEDVLTDGFTFHTVEVSDKRSITNFVTLFCVGNEPEHRDKITEIQNAHGITLRVHNPEVYHREGPYEEWIGKLFPKVDPKAWGKHYHWNIQGIPNRESVGHVLAVMRWGVGEKFEQFILDSIN